MYKVEEKKILWLVQVIFENFDKPRPDLSPEMEGQLKAIIEHL